MTKVEKLSIALTSELAEAVRGAVDAGDYASSSEAVREALRDWVEKRERRASAIAHLRRLIEEGAKSGLSAEREPLAEMLARNRARLAGMRGA